MLVTAKVGKVKNYFENGKKFSNFIFKIHSDAVTAFTFTIINSTDLINYPLINPNRTKFEAG